MARFLSQLPFPAALGFLLTLPFLGLQLINRRGYHEAVPLPLFAVLWLLAGGFALTLMPLLRHGRAGAEGRPATTRVALRVALLLAIAAVWAAIVQDQLPCFRGVPNCD